VAKYVQVKVSDASGANVTAPVGLGPETNWAKVLGATVMIGTRPVTAAPPSLVTVSFTSKVCPTIAKFGSINPTLSNPGSTTEIEFDETAPVDNNSAELPSTPVTVAVNSTVPAAVGLYTHVKFTADPPRRLEMTGGDDTRVADPSTNRLGDPVTLIASAWPVLVTVIATVMGFPTHTGSGSAVSGLPARSAGVWIVVQTVTSCKRFVLAQVNPVAVSVKHTTPGPVAIYVQVNVVAELGARVSPPGGIGPLASVTSVLPGPSSISDWTLVTSAPPVFVTVSVTLMTCPTDTTGGAAPATASAPGFSTVSTLDVTGPVLIGRPEFASIPETAVVRNTLPGSEPEDVHVNVMATPPGSVTRNVGVGPAGGITPPVPPKPKGRALTLSTVACPVLETVKVTRTGSPTHTCGVENNSDADKSGGS